MENSIRKKCLFFWKQLKDQGFISDKKFSRLIRTEEFSVGELAGFINRQLVETGQAAKVVADILNRIYPETEIVYVKAKTVSDFRNRFKLYKCRELNNFHHAHDAFLNIVVGNAYHTKFTANPYNYIKDKRDSGEDRPYDLDNFFNLKIKRADYVAWDKEYHLPFVSKTLERQTVNVVRKPLEQKGEFFDATIQRKTENKKDTLIMPLKGKDKRFFDIGKYGGYKSVKGAYFFVVEHKEKGKKVITFEQVFLMYADKIKTEKDLIEYCKNILNLEEPKIIEKKVKMGSKLIYENFPLYIQSRTGDRIVMSVAKEILLSKKSTEIFRKISKEYSLLKNKKADISTSITEKEYLDIYDEYIKLLKEGEYKNRSNSPINILINGRDVFKELEEKEKALTILSIHKSFGREGLSGVDLTFIKGKKGSSKIIFNKKITDKEVILINQSPTGLYESRKVLNKK